MPHRAFRIAYDGGPFRGFQRQPDQPTVEGCLWEAFAALDVVPDAAGYAAAGRTDAGVSALAQTVALRCPAWLDVPALNGALPPTVRAWAHADPDTPFHPRHDATSRAYTHVVHAPGIDLDRVVAAAGWLEGGHDFRHLTADREATSRRVTAVDVRRADPFLEVTVRAPGFLRQQVRRMVTLLVEVGAGERDRAVVEGILAGEPLPGHEGIRPADPAGLVLVDVAYDDLEFEPAGARAHAAFREQSIGAARRARMFRKIADGIE